MEKLLKPLKKTSLLFTFLILVIIAAWLWWSFTDIAIMVGNYGKIHTYTDIGLSMIMIVGFPLFIVGILYRGMLFGVEKNLDGKTGIGTISGIIGTILSGCSCCGLTLASYFGLLPIMALLPFDGLEVKILGTLGLLYALWGTYTQLETCKVKKK